VRSPASRDRRADPEGSRITTARKVFFRRYQMQIPRGIAQWGAVGGVASSRGAGVLAIVPSSLGIGNGERRLSAAGRTEHASASTRARVLVHWADQSASPRLRVVA